MRFLVLWLGLATLAPAAAPQIFSSGPNRTHLLELFSSEGCSSCPPAEQWLGGLRAAPGLWRDFVPVAFHVNYWDNLGWPDRFARREFTARQYAYASQWGGDSVYTPGFVLDGAEWKDHLSTGPAASAEPAGVLTVNCGADGRCRIKWAAGGEGEVYVALLGAGIVSRVRAGENNGRTLAHDFVVLALTKARLQAGEALVDLPRSPTDGVPRHALAAWVVRPGELTPRQATGGWLD